MTRPAYEPLVARPAWLGPEPTGAAAELCVTRGLLAACTAYTCAGIVPPADLLRRLVDRVGLLIAALTEELCHA